jgi:hypothetical protein
MSPRCPNDATTSSTPVSPARPTRPPHDVHPCALRDFRSFYDTLESTCAFANVIALSVPCLPAGWWWWWWVAVGGWVVWCGVK